MPILRKQAGLRRCIVGSRMAKNVLKLRSLQRAGTVWAGLLLVLPPAWSLAGETQPQDLSLDPAAALISATLSPEEKPRYRALVEQLASAEFEVRESALQRLVARGPAVLPLAEEFTRSQDAELAAQAKGIRGKILFQYDGYLPAAASLQEALNHSVDLGALDKESATLALERMARERNILLLYDPRCRPSQDLEGPSYPKGTQKRAGDALAMLAAHLQLAVVIRGEVAVVTSPEEAQRLSLQRHAFAWKSLGLDREEAARVGEGLKAFFPAQRTELHTGSEVLSVRGPHESIPRAARLIGLLKPGAPATLWPAPKQVLDLSSVTAELSKPFRVVLNRDDLVDALGDFRKQGLPLRVVSEGKVYNEPPYPEEIRGLAPLSLALHGLPLGLALRWIVKRTSFVGGQAQERALSAEVGDDGKAQLRVGPKIREVLRLGVGGADATFLKAPDAPAAWNAEADRAAREKLVAALRPHLELFPDFEIEQDLRVLRGRALYQGSTASVSRALELLHLWKEQGRPPVCPWFERLTEALDRKQAWDGRGLTAGKLLPHLRALGALSILLEDSPEGEAPNFKLNPAQAQLLPPGQHSLRDLLDDLAAKAGACWVMHWGVIVISPAAKRAAGAAEAGKKEVPDEVAKPELPAPAP